MNTHELDRANISLPCHGLLLLPVRVGNDHDDQQRSVSSQERFLNRLLRSVQILARGELNTPSEDLRECPRSVCSTLVGSESRNSAVVSGARVNNPQVPRKYSQGVQWSCVGFVRCAGADQLDVKFSDLAENTTIPCVLTADLTPIDPLPLCSTLHLFVEFGDCATIDRFFCVGFGNAFNGGSMSPTFGPDCGPAAATKNNG